MKSKLSFSVFSVAIAATGQAALPQYDPPQLQCRANFSGAFQLPNVTFFTNSTPSINDEAAVAISLGIVSGQDQDGIWYGGNGSGGIVFTTSLEAILSDVSLNDAGLIVGPQSFSSQDGIYFYDDSDMSSGLLTTLPFGASGWSATTVNAAGEVGFRAIFTGRNAWASLSGGATAIHAAEATLDPLSPYSFLFTPAFNSQRQIAGKARVGPPNQVADSQPDRIVLIDSDGTTTIIARDDDDEPTSMFDRFDNSVDVTDDGRVVFQANLVGGGRGVFVSDGMTTVTIATTAMPALTSVESFRPTISSSGLVAFRGMGPNGRAIFLGDGTELIELVSEHDLVDSDLGPARIDQHDSSPVFGGGPDINAHGDVAFQCGLTPPDNDQIEWGSGVFIVHRQQGLIGDLNCDGIISVSDIA
ncbi:MAG: hypothetical protein AB7N71_01880, partial [Phycisphaerae bacterium]